MQAMENGYFHRRSMSAERPLPTPTDTPYETPRVSSPHFSSFSTATPSTPLTNSTTSVQNQNTGKRRSQHGSGQYDPEQFTPTLHASLVSEILNLRRELDAKREFIEDLEANLSSSHAENDSLQSSLRRQGKETRALKRELQLHEDGTLSAMEALAKERDDVKEANAELKRRLDTSQKRLRSQEEDALRFKSSLEQERTVGVGDRKTLERRAELAEQRLRAVVEEVAASQAASLENSRVEEDEARPLEEAEVTIGSPESTRSKHSNRRNTFEGIRDAKPSLADELNFSDSNYDHSDAESVYEQQQPQTPQRNSVSFATQRPVTPTRSPQVRERVLANAEDRRSKVLGIVSSFEQQMKREEEASKRNSIVSRTFSQTSSRLRSSIRSSVEISDDAPRLMRSLQEALSSATVAEEVISREPVSFPRPTRSRAKSDPTLALASIPTELRDALFKPSLSTLTSKIEEIESKKEEPQIPFRPPVQHASTTTQTDFPEPTPEPVALPAYSTSSTQTDRPQTPPAPTRAAPAPPVPEVVPAIAVHPPSNPPSPQMTRRLATLPPQTKSVGVQTSMFAPTAMKSTAMQTELIRVDRRLAKLPPHLLPSALDEQEKAQQKAVSEARTVSQLKSAGNKESSSSLSNPLSINLPPPLPPLEEDDDDWRDNEAPRTMSTSRRPLRTQSVPVSPKLPQSVFGAEDPLDDLYSSDTEYATKTTVSRATQGGNRYSKRFEPPAPLPENDQVAFAPSTQIRDRTSIASRSTAPSSMDRKRFSKLPANSDPASEYQSRLGLMNRQGSIRSRSPSLGSVASSSNYTQGSGPRPPFIIPTRRSSREQYAKIRIQRSPASPPRRSGRSSPERASNKGGSKNRKKSPHKMLRKTRSSAAVEGITSSERPPPLPSLTAQSVGGQPASLSVPTGPYTSDVHKREIGIPQANGARLSTLIPTGGASVGSSVQHNVVDAITATTIGEWMFKYMRKRNTFGGIDTNAEAGKTSDSRHKRWVWLSPYERTVMWSNKQPRTNAALMGKAGRKLPIQSVLDVKDETAPPKEAKATGLFNRSILILTPDRALKFTAPTKERHYLWLTALSFLAHQSVHNIQNIPKFAFQPPNSPTIDSSVTVSSGRSRASSIRNGFRSNRSKAPSHASSGVATPVVGQQTDANVRREPPQIPMPDSAFAPTVPRVPHSRKRSISMTGTTTSRGRTAASTNNVFSGFNIPAAPSPALSVGDSSVRFQSVSGASSRRSVKQYEEETVVPPVEFTPDQSNRNTTELSPRPSGFSKISVDFGSNQNFFDAVGVVRMDAFSKSAAPKVASRPESSRGTKGPLQETANENDHLRQSSGESFIGPPNIGRYRGFRPQGNGLKGNAWKDF